MKEKNNKGLNIALWIVQSLLAIMFLMAGIMKLSMPIGQLYISMPWTKDVSEVLVRFIGISELLGGIGLMLPSIFRIKPILTPIAASALILVMILAMIFHISRGETNIIGMHIVIILFALFVALGRFKYVPILSKK
jgi:uncharacterized membrane protein YphA (DoxX/SURF4 family)